MPKKSGLTNRSVVNHQAGKGDVSRITDARAYRANFDLIDWGPRTSLRPGDRLTAILHSREELRFYKLRFY